MVDIATDIFKINCTDLPELKLTHRQKPAFSLQNRAQGTLKPTLAPISAAIQRNMAHISAFHPENRCLWLS
jgi:hypothetical protein